MSELVNISIVINTWYLSFHLLFLDSHKFDYEAKDYILELLEQSDIFLIFILICIILKYFHTM